MSLVKQIHELPCTDEALPCSSQLEASKNNIPEVAVIRTPWYVEENWITGSKPFRKDVAHATARSESLKAIATERAYFSTMGR